MAGDGARLKLCEVDVHGIDLREQARKATGLVGDGENDTGLVGTGIDLGLLGDADKAGVVVAVVLNGLGKDLKTVEIGTVTVGDRGKALARALHKFGRLGRVGVGGRLDALEACDIALALRERLLVRDDLLDRKS